MNTKDQALQSDWTNALPPPAGEQLSRHRAHMNDEDMGECVTHVGESRQQRGGGKLGRDLTKLHVCRMTIG